MRAQRLHHNDDDADWDSNRASDADVDGNNDDGGRQQRQQMQQQHSSPATQPLKLLALPPELCMLQFTIRAKSTGPGSSPTVVTATVSAHPLVF